MEILNRTSLEAKIRETRAVVPANILGEIEQFLRTAEDVQLHAINPFRFADRRRLDGTGALKAC